MKEKQPLIWNRQHRGFQCCWDGSNIQGWIILLGGWWMCFFVIENGLDYWRLNERFKKASEAKAAVERAVKEGQCRQ